MCAFSSIPTNYAHSESHQPIRHFSYSEYIGGIYCVICNFITSISINWFKKTVIKNPVRAPLITQNSRKCDSIYGYMSLKCSVAQFFSVRFALVLCGFKCKPLESDREREKNWLVYFIRLINALNLGWCGFFSSFLSFLRAHKFTDIISLVLFSLHFLLPLQFNHDIYFIYRFKLAYGIIQYAFGFWVVEDLFRVHVVCRIFFSLYLAHSYIKRMTVIGIKSRIFNQPYRHAYYALYMYTFLFISCAYLFPSRSSSYSVLSINIILAFKLQNHS